MSPFPKVTDLLAVAVAVVEQPAVRSGNDLDPARGDTVLTTPPCGVVQPWVTAVARLASGCTSGCCC